MSSKFTKWDVCDYLKTEEDYAHYLNAAIEEGDPDLLQMAIGDIARAKGMTSVAEDAGLGRESLYKALRAEANPSFKTIAKVAKALGLKITFVQA